MSLKPSAMKWVAIDLAVVLLIIGAVLWINPWSSDEPAGGGGGGVAVEFDKALADKGKTVSDSNTCTSCHSTTGGAGAGPTWKGLYGATGKRGGKVDEAYLKETLVNPPAVMAQYKGKFKDADIEQITEYIKSLAQ